MIFENIKIETWVVYEKLGFAQAHELLIDAIESIGGIQNNWHISISFCFDSNDFCLITSSFVLSLNWYNAVSPNLPWLISISRGTALLSSCVITDCLRRICHFDFPYPHQRCLKCVRTCNRDFPPTSIDTESLVWRFRLRIFYTQKPDRSLWAAGKILSAHKVK